jgi:hypothetical protein
MAMHPWHDTYLDDALVERAFPVVIEIPKGSKNKYELDRHAPSSGAKCHPCLRNELLPFSLSVAFAMRSGGGLAGPSVSRT